MGVVEELRLDWIEGLRCVKDQDFKQYAAMEKIRSLLCMHIMAIQPKDLQQKLTATRPIRETTLGAYTMKLLWLRGM